ncbi:hypothetical protein [Pararhodobacter oceanensis]|uniref:Uncharacterized protein n=1 Tax=Pararhodobacter oceanensis TaxID=2172121 RepID=A0A2T8HY20_9RHOB|nr:hypothetical protein [Pararhodobacter oceanensis]PVH30294.1 hypothetical protein DDE20_01690 [Pararhodobacter oceanensis]
MKDPMALARLQAIAALKKDAELARLAEVAQSRNRLKASLDALRRTEAPLDGSESGGQPVDPAMVGARLAHLRWVEAQQRLLNQKLAMVTADYLRQKPTAARAFGRATVLEQLVERQAEDLRRRGRK